MPELRKCVITGGGLAGVAGAYWVARQSPQTKVTLLEKGEMLAPWCRHAPPGPSPIGSTLAFEPSNYPRGAAAAERILAKWPTGANRGWLESIGLPLEEGTAGALLATDPRGLPERLLRLLEAHGVELRLGYALESVARQPDGGFRLWSRDGDPVEADRLLLATGGERNHGLKLAGELGTRIEPPHAAFLRLRTTAGSKAARLGPISREARLRCIRTGEEATGPVEFSQRGLEGLAVSQLSARTCSVWREMDYRFRLEVDWLPGTSGAVVRNELDARTRRGTRRAIGDEALFGLNDRQWGFFLDAARVDPTLAWPRLKPKKLQALVQRLKGDQLEVCGMGLPAGERAWAGGVVMDGIDSGSGECLATPGLFFAGEMLDMLGLPAGPQLDLAWASGYIAGSAMALD